MCSPFHPHRYLHHRIMNISQFVTETSHLLSTHKLELLCLCSFSFLYLCFLLTLLPLSTIIFMHLMPIPLLVLCYQRCKAVKDQGLAVYLPVKMQEYLFEKSLIDVLMTVWDTPRLVEYLKRLMYPFFVQMDREEALLMFEELSPDVAAAMDAKGLIHVLPDTVKKVLITEAEMKETLFLAPMLKHHPLHRPRSSLDMDSEGVKGSAVGRKRPSRVMTDVKPGVRTEVISSSKDPTSATPLIKGSDNLSTVISRLRHKVTSTVDPHAGADLRTYPGVPV